ncbi:MAG: LPS O-antigen subunit length determinant protein (WzzB/FepE family) [Flavobacteriaceae bacterium]|jgi:LPS O-antigen subunit length determinant protein (WzzB/FepE family)
MEQMNETKKQGGGGMMWIVLIIVVALLFILLGKDKDQSNIIVEPTQDEQVQDYEDTSNSNSDEVEDIEADLEETSFNDIDSDLE